MYLQTTLKRQKFYFLYFESNTTSDWLKHNYDLANKNLYYFKDKDPNKPTV